MVCFVVLLSIGLAIIYFASRPDLNRSEPSLPTRSSVHLDDAQAPFTKLIVRLRKEKDLVGLAAMVAVDGKVIASAADGERKKGTGVWLQIGDRWHLGGITKSITSTMIARLVESGKMKWSDSIGQCFPDATIHEDWKAVTLKQLLTDTAGARANFPMYVWRKRPALGRESTQMRRDAVREMIAKKPANPPGKTFVYSSVGITIAGAMAEKATGTSWEDLVKQEVFEPQHLTARASAHPGARTQPSNSREVTLWSLAAKFR